MTKKDSGTYGFYGFFKNEEEYLDFVAMARKDERDNVLPIVMSRNNPFYITLTDIQTFSNRFKTDTDLDIIINFHTCEYCGDLNMTMVIDRKEAFSE